MTPIMWITVCGLFSCRPLSSPPVTFPAERQTSSLGFRPCPRATAAAGAFPPEASPRLRLPSSRGAPPPPLLRHLALWISNRRCRALRWRTPVVWWLRRPLSACPWAGSTGELRCGLKRAPLCRPREVPDGPSPRLRYDAVARPLPAS
jgi:hypothetical protein